MKREIRDQARQMRLDGMSIRDICRELGVAKSSVSLWVRDIELTEEQQTTLKKNQVRWGAQNEGAKSNRANALEMRKSHQQEGRLRAQQGNALHLAGCMLYWAEGAKHRNRVVFVNSDPHMIMLFMRFVRQEFALADEAFSVQIHCHKTEAIPQIEAYWINLLALPASCLMNTQVKKGSESRRNILKNGVCSININNTRIAMHIYGAIQEYAGFDNPDWLF